MEISRARPEDADVLTRIAFSAKGYWGYPEHWMKRWRDSLTITPEFVRENEVYAAGVDGEPAGFYTLTEGGRTLEHLWVTPSRIDSGIGRGLFEHAVARAMLLGMREVEIEADPNAEGFYLTALLAGLESHRGSVLEDKEHRQEGWGLHSGGAQRGHGRSDGGNPLARLARRGGVAHPLRIRVEGSILMNYAVRNCLKSLKSEPNVSPSGASSPST